MKTFFLKVENSTLYFKIVVWSSIETAVETLYTSKTLQVWRSIEAAVKVCGDSLKEEQVNEVNR